MKAEGCVIVVAILAGILGALGIAWLARGAVWAYDPGMDPSQVACIDACANQCGLETGSPVPLPTTIVCLRRLAAGEPVPFPCP